MYLHTGVKRVCTKNVTLTHNYKEKAFSFSSITSIEKTMYRKKGMVTRQCTRNKLTVTIWFMRLLQIRSKQLHCLGALNCISTKKQNKTNNKPFPSSLQSSIRCFQSVLTKGFFLNCQKPDSPEMEKKQHLSGKAFYLKHISEMLLKVLQGE